MTLGHLWKRRVEPGVTTHLCSSESLFPTQPSGEMTRRNTPSLPSPPYTGVGMAMQPRRLICRGFPWTLQGLGVTGYTVSTSPGSCAGGTMQYAKTLFKVLPSLLSFLPLFLPPPLPSSVSLSLRLSPSLSTSFSLSLSILAWINWRSKCSSRPSCWARFPCWHTNEPIDAWESYLKTNDSPRHLVTFLLPGRAGVLSKISHHGATCCHGPSNVDEEIARVFCSITPCLCPWEWFPPKHPDGSGGLREEDSILQSGPPPQVDKHCLNSILQSFFISWHKIVLVLGVNIRLLRFWQKNSGINLKTLPLATDDKDNNCTDLTPTKYA